MKDTKSPFKRPKLKSQSGRNPFDMSYKTVFTAPFGTLVPCGFWRVNANDYVEITNENQLVCPQLKRPAFMRLKEHVDYFFVGLAQIWTPGDNFITGEDYYFSTAIAQISNPDNPLDPNVPAVVPMFDPSFLKKMFEYADTQTDLWNFSQIGNSMRLLDMLNYGYFYDLDNLDDPGSSAVDVGISAWPNMNFFALCAYQKAYYDYYRNSMYEKNRVEAYNLDDISTKHWVMQDQDFSENEERFFRIFELHYRWLKKDYFTSTQTAVLPNTNMIGFSGFVTAIPNYGQLAPNDVVTFSPGSFTPNAGQSIGANSQSGTNTDFFLPSNDLNVSTGTVTVSAIRFAFAYDKLLRRMREAGQDFDKQMLAQFGVTPVDQRHGKCYRIGGFVNRLNPSSVNDTASALGNIGGNIDSYNINNRPLKFHCKEPGFIIAIHSTSIDSDYCNNRVSRDNVAGSRFDWFHHDFENLGLQPIFRFEYDLHPFQPIAKSRQIIGLNRRYSEFKSHIDEVHTRVSKAADTDLFDYQAWSAQYDKLINVDHPLTMRQLVHDPNQLNNILPVAYRGTVNEDPFIINMYHRFHKISNMSVYGEDFH